MSRVKTIKNSAIHEKCLGRHLKLRQDNENSVSLTHGTQI